MNTFFKEHLWRLLLDLTQNRKKYIKVSNLFKIDTKEIEKEIVKTKASQ